MYYRGIIHVHSCFSYDSVMKPEMIVRKAEKNKLNFIIVTDHETTKGAVAVQKIVRKRNLNMQVPLAAEYKTSCGDMIAAFITNEITDMDFGNFCKEVREQGGILLFPHPLIGHREIDYVAENSDLIETFNSRTDKEANRKAYNLAQKYHKPMYAGSDSHLKGEFLNAVLSIKSNEDLKNALLNFKINIERNNSSTPYNVIKSQYIKAIKMKNPWLFASQTKKLMAHVYNRNLLRPFQ